MNQIKQGKNDWTTAFCCGHQNIRVVIVEFGAENIMENIMEIAAK